MIELQPAKTNMPETFEPVSQPIHGTVGLLPYWDTCLDASRNVRELLVVLDKNKQIPGVLVTEKNNLVGMLPRERVYEKLGRPFGVELFLKMNCRQFIDLLGISTLVLPAETAIDEAVKVALKRDDNSLYEPIAVVHPQGYRVISMFSLLKAQQITLQDLYTEVRYLSTRDPLTLVNNRRGLFDTVQQHLLTVRHFDLEYAVMMLDIDNFKNVNDRYGHIIGDQVIKSFAQRVYSNIREKDVLGRFGGEEFVIFLPDVSRESALSMAEGLRQDMAGLFHTINGFQIRVTISIGVSHSRGSTSTLDRLLTEADQAVYLAKAMGRNKVMMWSDGIILPDKERLVFRKTRYEPDGQTEQTFDHTLQGLLRMLYLRDYETEAHTARVSGLAMNLAKLANLPETAIEGIHHGALLHDIGKIGIPDRILFKPGKLTEAEWAIMQKHPQYAYDLIHPIPYFQHALDIPYCHHEHWDGSGYPRGLRMEEIPIAARIFSIVDVWDALSSDRPYRPAWKEEDIKRHILEQAGKMFDPTLASLFLENLDLTARNGQ